MHASPAAFLRTGLAAAHTSSSVAVYRAPTFGGRDDLRYFRKCLLRAPREHGAAIHAYALMTNHLHLLATPSLATSMPKMMQSIGRVDVQYFNATYRRTGTLLEGRYKAAYPPRGHEC